MTRSIELIVEHDGSEWRATGAGLCLRAARPEELDEAVRRHLRKSAAPREATIAHLRFDFDGFPSWMRQHAAHYFNRRIGPEP